MKRNSAPQEYDIASDEFNEIDNMVEEGIRMYDWNSIGTFSYFVCRVIRIEFR